MKPILPAAVRRSLLLILVIMLCAVARSAAQTDAMSDAGGTTYVVAFPDTVRNTFDARYPNFRVPNKTFVYIYSAVDNVVSIVGNGFTRTNMSISRGLTVIDLASEPTVAKPIFDQYCKPIAATYRITARNPVIVHQYVITTFGAEAWTPLPVEAWGNEYYAAAHEGEVYVDITVPTGKDGWRGPNRMAGGIITVIAAFDDTRITIVPNGQVHTFCNPTSVMLRAGEAYQISSWVDTLTVNIGGDQPDFGGSRIFSTKPVGVITGNTRAQLIHAESPLGQNSKRNMLLEWLSPVEHHGTQFVYLPTNDTRRPTGASGEDIAGMRQVEFVRVYGTSEFETSGSFMQGGARIDYDRAIEQSKFVELMHSTALARVHTTDKPAQAIMSTPGIARSAIRTTGEVSDQTWGSSMVTLVPRERWGTMSPFYAPNITGAMDHYINVVTDTAHRFHIYLDDGSRFPLTTRIAGTDLIWGTMSISAGAGGVIEGTNGATFSGHIYGTAKGGGSETFRSSGRVYEEYLGVAYAYPLAARNVVVGDGDSLRIQTELACGPEFREMTIDVDVMNEDPIGLRSVHLDSAVNTRIASMNPDPIIGAIKAQITVRAIDVRQSSSAIVVITDKSGKITRVPFVSIAEVLDITPLTVDFGELTPGTRAERVITLSNPLDRPIDIRSLRMINRNPAFAILLPSVPFTIAARSSATVTIEAAPLVPLQTFVDTLEIDADCARWKVGVTVESSNPCIDMDDLDFGVTTPGTSKTMSHRICNEGTGEITFNNPSGGAIVEWYSNRFSVSPTDIAALKSARLGPGDCIDINVTFSAPDTGRHSTVVRYWASTRRCRDTAYWNAIVSPSASSDIETGVTNSLSASEPNPFGIATDIAFTLARGTHALLIVYDARGERVATLVDGVLDAGPHSARFDAALLPAGVYHYRLSVGEWSQVRTMVKR